MTNNTQGETKEQLQIGQHEVAGAKLQLLALELRKEIKEEFFSHVKVVIWIVAFILTIGSLGGFYSLRGLIDQRISESIAAKSADFKEITDKALQEVIDLRVTANAALAEVRQLQQQMGESSESARKLIDETMRYWDAAKVSIDQTQHEKSGDDGQAEKIMNCLVNAGVKDADVTLFLAVVGNDLSGVEAALAAGGSPVATVSEIVDRHRDSMKAACPSLLR